MQRWKARADATKRQVDDVRWMRVNGEAVVAPLLAVPCGGEASGPANDIINVIERAAAGVSHAHLENRNVVRHTAHPDVVMRGAIRSGDMRAMP